MSLYNELFKTDQHTFTLLSWLDLDAKSFWEEGRFRDCYLNKAGDTIILLMRGGESAIKDTTRVKNLLRLSPYYKKDFDDDYDDTYKYFEFEVPYSHTDEAKQLAPATEPPTLKQKFDELTNALTSDQDSPLKQHALKIGEKIMQSLEEAQKSGKKEKIIEI